jgi:hypothetical protein
LYLATRGQSSLKNLLSHEVKERTSNGFTREISLQSYLVSARIWINFNIFMDMIFFYAYTKPPRPAILIVLSIKNSIDK